MYEILVRRDAKVASFVLSFRVNKSSGSVHVGHALQHCERTEARVLQITSLPAVALYECSLIQTQILEYRMKVFFEGCSPRDTARNYIGSSGFSRCSRCH